MQSVKTKEKSEKMSYSKKFTLDKCLSKEPNMTSNTLNKSKSKGLKCNISSNQSENIRNYFSPKNKVGLFEIKKNESQTNFQSHNFSPHLDFSSSRSTQDLTPCHFNQQIRGRRPECTILTNEKAPGELDQESSTNTNTT